jgi:hypothetical protein
MIEVPAVVRNKARAAGAEDWLARLPALVSSLEADWSIAIDAPTRAAPRPSWRTPPGRTVPLPS